MINQAIPGTRKSFSLTKGKRIVGLTGISWSWPTSLVRLETADQYCEDVGYWSKLILSDTSEIVEQDYLKPD